VERNAWTLAHERYNADWIEEQGVGMVVKNFFRIARAVRELLAPETYRQYRARVSAIRNTAVYEIPDVLDKILAIHATSAAAIPHTDWWGGPPGPRGTPSSRFTL